jgi:hypothetical protein
VMPLANFAKAGSHLNGRTCEHQSNSTNQTETMPLTRGERGGRWPQWGSANAARIVPRGS